MGVDDLLEMVTSKLRCRAEKPIPTAPLFRRSDRGASGQGGRGPVATLLVQNGTLHQSDIIIAGTSVAASVQWWTTRAAV